MDGGFSKIANSFNPSSPGWSVQSVPSWNAGLYYNFHPRGPSIFGVELLFMKAAGNEKIEADLIDNTGKNVGQSTGYIYRHISYLSLPVYYGLKLDKLTFNVGFQVSYALASGGRDKGKATYYGSIVTWDNKLGKLGIDPYDFGARAGLFFPISDKFSIEAVGYYGINDILKEEGPMWTWKVRQITAGLRYMLFSTEERN